MKVLLLTLITLVALTQSISAQRLSGSVKSASGQPLAHVLIFPTRSLKDIAETDDYGKFSVARFDTVIAFRRDGFRPLTKPVDSSIATLDVVLQDAASTQWVVTRCANNDKSKRIGFTLKLAVPNGASARKGADVDHENFSIGYGSKSNRAWLSGIAGPYGSLGIPPYAWILNATEFSERSVKVGNREGSELRGRLRDGTYWRYIGWLGEEVTYHGLTKDQAAFFDGIFAGACAN